MNLTLNLSSDKLNDEKLQAFTRELCHKINAKTEHEATLQAVEETDAKGKAVIVGLIALKLVIDVDHIDIAMLIILLEEYERRGIHIRLKKENGEFYTVHELKEIVKNRDWQKIITFSATPQT